MESTRTSLQQDQDVGQPTPLCPVESLQSKNRMARKNTVKKPKQDPGIEIDSVKYFAAQSNWVTFWRAQDVEIPNFGKFLGLSQGPVLHTRIKRDHYTLKIRASAVKKIEKLASPYWYTFLKAYQIRKQPHGTHQMDSSRTR